VNQIEDADKQRPWLQETTLVLVRHGHETARVSGALQLPELRRWIGAHAPV